ncbi:hypothetical protein VNI00_000362 [Paramarasmius palmivorus]|uniref:BTB domain-containing protein n=1 Tax=Paramarasmius palmivorus TaxID=297713 RepID=A0AAW0EC85_9AGAR
MAQVKASPRSPALQAKIPLSQRLGPPPPAGVPNRPRRTVSPFRRRSPSPRRFGNDRDGGYRYAPGTGAWRRVGRSPSPLPRDRYRGSSSVESYQRGRFRSRSRSPSRRSRSRSPVRRTPPRIASGTQPTTGTSNYNVGTVPKSPIRFTIAPQAPKPSNTTITPQTDPSNTTKPILDHPTFNFADGTVCFIVENRLRFRVHSYFLRRDSIVFKDLLASPGTGPDGGYIIQGLKCDEFESLLGFFYDGMYIPSPTAIPLQAWINLLSISTQYKFQRAREHAVAAIDAHFAASQPSSTLSPIDMLVIAEKHGIERWATSAYRQLSDREEPISQSEAEKIGLTSLVKVARDREQRLKSR